MGKKTLKFDNVQVTKKQFHVSKQPVALNLVNVNQILKSDKFEQSDKGFKYFIGYKDDNMIRVLCIKYSENRGKIMHLMIEKDSVHKIWWNLEQN